MVKVRFGALALVAALAVPATAYADMPQGQGEAVQRVVSVGGEQLIEYEVNGPAEAASASEFMELGAVEHAGRTETWYSSEVLPHWQMGEWEADAEGFWRTSEGYYVVAASDLPYGSVVETSRGAAMVLDCGCPDGVTDFYVNWL